MTAGKDCFSNRFPLVMVGVWDVRHHFPPSSPPSTVPCRSAPWEIWPGNRWASASSVPLADQSYAGEHKAFTQHGLSSQSEPPPIHPSELSEPPSSTLRDFLNLPWPSEAA